MGIIRNGTYQISLAPRCLTTSLLPGPGTSSGPRSTTPYPRGQRFPAPPSRFPVSAKHTTEPTCARRRTITDVLQIITPCWCTVSRKASIVHSTWRHVGSFVFGFMLLDHLKSFILPLLDSQGATASSSGALDRNIDPKC